MITARGGGLEDLLGEYYAALAAGDPWPGCRWQPTWR